MKLTAIILFAASLQVSAKGFSQITLSENNTPLRKVFTKIQQQSGYDFVSTYELLKKAGNVTVNVRNVSLQKALEECLKGKPLTYVIIGKTVVIQWKENDYHKTNNILAVSDVLMPPPVEIHGKVVNQKGEPLQNVSVLISGTRIGTTTDNDGRFTLTLPDNKNIILEISSVGYQAKKIKLGSQTEINVVLELEVTGLSDVVVVGYGTQRKSDLTGAISQIGSRDIDSRPVPDITTSLQGLLPGLNIQPNNGDPGAAVDINIRGFNSINGGSPLILVDGIEGDIDRVNPADVQTVTVLKDAASAAIYGARGAFGVILITTKKGKSGALSINYNNNFGQTTPTTRRDFISDPYQFGKTVDAAIFGYNGSSYTGYSDADWDTIQMVSQGKIDPFYSTLPNGNNKFFYNTDWYSYLFRKWQPFENHSISVSGGTDRIQAYVSGRYYKSTSIQNIVNAPLSKYNLRANVIFHATKWLQLSDNIQFSTNDQIEYGGAKNGFGGIWSSSTFYWLFPFMPNNVNGTPFDYNGNGPQAALEAGSNWRRNYSEQFVNTFSGVLTPLKGLVLNFDYSNSINHIANSTRLNKVDHLTGAKMNLQTVGQNSLTEVRNRNYYKALNIYGTYSKNIARDHHFKLLLGYNQEHFNSDNITAQQGDLLIPDLSSLGLGTNLLRADGSANVWSIRGYFGRFNYDYKGKYLLEVNGRYDGSSRFPQSSRWGLFPSVSGGWLVSRENFWKPLQDVVSSFKIRASYGKLGNQNVPLYTFSEVMGVGQTSWLNNDTKLNYVATPAPLPSVVTWEDTKVIDYGVDLGFLQNKITASFDWYRKDIIGMYVPGSPLPGVFGASEPKENIANLRDIGFELGLGYNDQFNLGGSPVHVRAMVNLYNFNGVITKYPNPNGLMSTYWAGEKLGQIWGYHVDGQFQSDEEAQKYQSQFDKPSVDLAQVYNFVVNGISNIEWKGLRAGDIKYVDTNGDGKIGPNDNTLADHGDLQPIGNAMPQFPFGFSFGADWKGFDISIVGAGVAHQDWYPRGFIYWGSYDRPYSTFIRKDLIEDAWSPDNSNGKYPQIYRGYTALGAHRFLYESNDYYLTNLGYLRVKNLTVGYTFPKSLTERAKIQKLRIYFSGENILTWRFGDLTKYVDPEQAGSGINYSNPGNATSETDLQDWPIGKTFSFGINLAL